MSITNVMPILRQLFAGYANSQLPKEGQAVYFRLLQDIPPDELQVVVDQCLAECKFLPTIAEIRERHRTITHPIDNTSAIEAWGSVTKAIRHVGSWGVPTFHDPITAKIVEFMGWTYLCQSEDQMADRAHFLKQYEAMQGRQVQANKLLPQARALAERHGLLSVGEVLALPENGTDKEQ